MTNGKEVDRRFRPSGKGGIPWFAFLDSRGEAVATSDGPEGNVGCPVEPAEIDHFVGMLKKAASRIPAERLEAIEKGLRAFAAQIKAARR